MLRRFKKCLTLKSDFLIIVVLVSVYCLAAFYDAYNYEYIDRDKLDLVLYKKTHPDAWKDGRPNCSYEGILESRRTIHAWAVQRDYGDFDIRGIENGTYSPEHCNPLYSVAIIVTYRNRQEQLDIFLPYMHNFLRKQNIHYKIYLVEQQDDKPWNKGLLYNLGAQQAMKDNFPCLILHDVDLIPLDEANLYACTNMPHHMSASIDKFRFVLPYYSLVGGVISVTSQQYTELNGFSNQFLEWGGEDDDFARRIEDHNFSIIRFPMSMSRYTMLRHRPQARNAQRGRLLREHGRAGAAAAAADGLGTARLRPRVRNHRLFTLLGVRT